MAEILCVYRQVAMLRAEGENTHGKDSAGGDLAIVSYDEKPGIQRSVRPRRIARHGPAPAQP
jgi:hypothetical protein